MNTLSLFIGILIGSIIFIVAVTGIKIFKLFKTPPESDSDTKSDEIKDHINSFIDTSQGIPIDATDLNAGNELIAMKYKLEMFKLRNRFYKDDFS